MTVFEDARTRRNGNGNGHGPGASEGWLTGSPMDPCAGELEPLNLLPGFPFLHAGMAAIISGPTGRGRSSVVQACAYDAALAGLRVAYLGGEVTEAEFNDRARLIAEKREDEPFSVRNELAKVRYLDLHSTLSAARHDPARWVADAAESFDVVIIDPLNDALEATKRGHENADYIGFYATLVEPLRTRGSAVVMLDNIGHSEDAQERPIGASAKQSKADLMFSCSAEDSPPMLRLKATKVRAARAAFGKGTTWVCPEDSLRLTMVGRFEAAMEKQDRKRSKEQERLRSVEQALTRVEQAVVPTLGESTGIAETTLRRYLKKLEKEGAAEQGKVGWRLAGAAATSLGDGVAAPGGKAS